MYMQRVKDKHCHIKNWQIFLGSNISTYPPRSRSSIHYMYLIAASLSYYLGFQNSRTHYRQNIYRVVQSLTSPLWGKSHELQRQQYCHRRHHCLHQDV